MKRLTLALLLLALLFTAAGCGRIIKNDYRSVEPHSEPSGGAQAQPQEEQIPVVGNRNELRGNVLSFVRSWTELGTLRVRGYDGDISIEFEGMEPCEAATATCLRTARTIWEQV